MILESKRLKLRAFEIKDKEALINLLNDEKISKWIDNLPYPYLEKHAEWWLKKGSKKKHQFAITLKEKSILIGSFKISKNGEIGCWIGTNYWKMGFASEAIERIKQFAFNELNLNRIWAATHEDNKAPFQVLEKTGFTQVDDKPYYVEGIGDTKIRPHFELTKQVLNQPLP